MDVDIQDRSGRRTARDGLHRLDEFANAGRIRIINEVTGDMGGTAYNAIQTIGCDTDKRQNIRDSLTHRQATLSY